MEDWRYGPLGKTGRYKTDSEQEPPPPPLSDLHWRRRRAAHEKSQRTTARDAGPEASESSLQARLNILREMFKVSHNEPSTPSRSLTREIGERTIWGYWAQGFDEMPDLFKLCVDTWQRDNPHWEVRILSKTNVHEFVSAIELPNRFMQMLSHQTASDCVRLAVLSRYGGVWLDVSVILRVSLDTLCWNDIEREKTSAAVYFHPHYGTEALGGDDFVESWFLATKPGNPFFIRWRDLLRELLHNRLDVQGLLEHPLYRGLNLEGFETLNQEYASADFDFREYLAIHVMCHRLLETDSEVHRQWRSDFRRFDATASAFRLQIHASQSHVTAAQALTSCSAKFDGLLRDLSLVKLTTPHYGPLLFLSKDQLQDERTLLGRLLSAKSARADGSRRPASTFARSAVGNRHAQKVPSSIFQTARFVTSGARNGASAAMLRKCFQHLRHH